MSDPDSEFFQRWMTLWKKIDAVFNAELHRAGISYREYLLLESLQAAPQGMEPSALADARDMSRQHVNLLLRQLEGAELVTRTGATVDKRRRIIALSPLGEEHHQGQLAAHGQSRLGLIRLIRARAYSFPARALLRHTGLRIRPTACSCRRGGRTRRHSACSNPAGTRRRHRPTAGARPSNARLGPPA